MKEKLKSGKKHLPACFLFALAASLLGGCGASSGSKAESSKRKLKVPLQKPRVSL